MVPNDCQDPLTNYAIHSLNSDHQDSVEMYRLLLNQPGWDLSPLITGRDSGGMRNTCAWWWACPDSACVRLIRDEFSFDFIALSWETQFHLAMGNFGPRGNNMPALFLSMLGHNTVSSQIAQSYDGYGRTVLHMVASQLEWTCLTLSPSWTEFVRQLLLCGADVHHQDNAGYTPFAYLLHTAQLRIPERVRAWANLLNTAGMDLTIYGRREKTMWSALTPLETVKSRYIINAWNYGACAHDWTVEFLRTIPIFEIKHLPGTWTGDLVYSTDTICWSPEKEDEPTAPGHWSKVRDVVLYSRSSTNELLSSEEYDGHGRELDDVQDDCGAIVRLIQNSSRSCSRLRSCSQPPKSVSRIIDRSRPWLPRCHRCLYDGRVKFPVGDYWNPSNRRCAKGLHDEYSHNIEDYQKRIRQQMRRFQTRFLNLDELRALPYTAYHRNWKTDEEVVL